ncbi:hypothetical protein ACQR16_27635 [Bradyrhizobium oligotrophicum]|uniref:hypothetical protein n=1 Tax=Bradyrhizobium oligotrophicum TaxID=44255 RepID=UPI003EB96496
MATITIERIVPVKLLATHLFAAGTAPPLIIDASTERPAVKRRDVAALRARRTTI